MNCQVEGWTNHPSRLEQMGETHEFYGWFMSWKIRNMDGLGLPLLWIGNLHNIIVIYNRI